MTVPMNWLRQTRRTYFGNAAAQRDFRVQLRGNRSMMLFGVYLAILMLVGFFKYDSIAGNTQSVVQAQRELRDFYMYIVQLLGGMVSIVTPGLAATTIVMERQRRSLDLVFSAPVQPRYYLVGKIIAVYRYIWMLLILSLPVTAACVVLGGASWSDVLTVYGLLSIHGLLFGAIGLMMSTVCAKPVSAIVWTYVCVAGYIGLSGSFAGSVSAMRYMGGGGETNFLVGINPFTTIFTVGTYTTIQGYHVPNYLLAGLALLVAVRICLLGAGSLLSEGRETANLRIHWAVLTAAAAYGLGYVLVSSGALSVMTRASTGIVVSSAVGPSTISADPISTILGTGVFWLLAPLALVIPMLSAYGDDGARRQKANGWFGLRNVFDGTPAGGLPYLVLLVATATVFALLGVHFAGGILPKPWFLAYVVFALGFWSLFWSVGRIASSYGVGLRTARTVVVASFIVLVVLPVPFLSAISAETFSESGISAWNLYALYPVLRFNKVNMIEPLLYGAAFLALALVLNALSERKRTLREAAVA